MPLAVVHSPEEWRNRFGASSRAVLTIGNFDGVHVGHVKILSGVVQHARRSGHLAAVVTFFPHPARVLHPESAPPLLETLEQRLAQFDELGMDAALVLRFDLALSQLSPQDFARMILCSTLHASAIHVGDNFRFGHRQAGDVNLLASLGKSAFAEENFEVERVQPVVVRGQVVSSTAIRRALTQGRVSYAARLLARPFALTGEIRTGTGTGRRLQFPTLNLSTSQEMLPARGVYATESVVEGRVYHSATNVGMRPTFDGSSLTIESHFLDFSRELTRGELQVRFCRRLRDEQKFSGPEALREQIQRDMARTRAYFARIERVKKYMQVRR